MIDTENYALDSLAKSNGASTKTTMRGSTVFFQGINEQGNNNRKNRNCTVKVSLVESHCLRT